MTLKMTLRFSVNFACALIINCKHTSDRAAIVVNYFSATCADIVLFLEIQLIIALLLLLQDLANTAAQKPLNVEFSTVKFTIFPQSLSTQVQDLKINILCLPMISI